MANDLSRADEIAAHLRAAELADLDAARNADRDDKVRADVRAQLAAVEDSWTPQRWEQARQRHRSRRAA